MADGSDTPRTPEQLVAGLVRLLTVDQNAEDAFTGPPQVDGHGRVFGGQVIAQALQSAQICAPEGMEALAAGAEAARRRGYVGPTRVEVTHGRVLVTGRKR